MKKLITLFVFFSMINLTNAQFGQSFKEQMNFASYLLKNKMADDCIVLLQKEMNVTNNAAAQRDSLYYLLGHAYFNNNIYDSAAIYFSSVSPLYNDFSECRLLSAFSFTQINNYSDGIKQLNELDTVNPKNKEFRNFQLSGIYLLSRDTSNFARVSKTFTYTPNDINYSEKKIIQLNNDLKYVRHKSGFLAGMMSAIVPGLGKVYAGKIGQGATSFIPITLMGLSTFETYKKVGVKSPRFFLTAGLFSVFYIGNIWGSVLSVSVSRNEKYNEIDNQILLNLRIPLQQFIGIYQ